MNLIRGMEVGEEHADLVQRLLSEEVESEMKGN